ncbi:MAG: efflux transporter outer membrane subunit [Azospirillaceae bacterium]|nr:efflux transporter outer membrane subunit [Azospirillaceae bacterium]
MPLALPTTTRTIIRMAPIAAAIALTACTVGPDFTPPASPGTPGYVAAGDTTQADGPGSATQHVALGQKIASDWWSLFHSQALDDVIRQAIAGNRTLASAKATLSQAQEQIAAARGEQLPHADLSVGAAREEEDYAAFGLPTKSATFNLFSVGPSVSYALDVFGGLRRALESAEADAEAQRFQLAAAYLVLTGNVADDSIDIASSRAELRALDDIVGNDQQNLDLVRAQVGAGSGTEVDVATAQSQLANDRTLIPPVRQRLSAARHAVSLLVGRAPADWSPPAFDLSEFTLPRELPITLPSDLVHERPDILAAEAQLHAANATIGVATARLYPQINLTAAISQGALSAQNLFDPAYTGWSVGAGLVAPLFHGGELEAGRRRAIAALQGSMATYQQTVLQAFTQVADVLQALIHDDEEVTEQRRARDAADEALRLTRLRYASGSVGILPVLDAQRQVAQSRLGYIRADAQRYHDSIKLLVATGSGWRNAAPAEATTPATATVHDIAMP